jgi:hypothetical protein
MNQQQQWRTDQLEEMLSSRSSLRLPAYIRLTHPDDIDAEVREMAMLARHLQTSPALRPAPAFAQRLEQRVLAHSISHRQTKATRQKWHWLLGGGSAPHIRLALAALLLCILVGSTLLAMTATVSNPNNPLYSVKVWEQQAQLALASSPQNRATIGLQIIRDRLREIPDLTGASHAGAYQQALDQIEQQIGAVNNIIQTLPVGSQRQNLVNQLATLKTNARSTLHGVLPKLPFTEQVTTTTELGQLGMPVPDIQGATVAFTAPPASQATITVTGTNLTSSMHLLVNNQELANGCVLQQNSCTFTISWHGKTPIKLIAIFNADGTSAQTTHVTLTDANGQSNRNGNNGNGANGQSNRNGSRNNANSSNSNKGTPGNSNNGHAENGAKSSSAPTPHK